MRADARRRDVRRRAPLPAVRDTGPAVREALHDGACDRPWTVRRRPRLRLDGARPRRDRRRVADIGPLPRPVAAPVSGSPTILPHGSRRRDTSQRGRMGRCAAGVVRGGRARVLRGVLGYYGEGGAIAAYGVRGIGHGRAGGAGVGGVTIGTASASDQRRRGTATVIAARPLWTAGLTTSYSAAVVADPRASSLVPFYVAAVLAPVIADAARRRVSMRPFGRRRAV